MGSSPSILPSHVQSTAPDREGTQGEGQTRLGVFFNREGFSLALHMATEIICVGGEGWQVMWMG